MYVGLRQYNLFRFVPIIRDSLFENMTDGIIVIDKNGVLVDYNEMASIFTKLKKAQMGEQAEDALLFWNELKCNELNINERIVLEYNSEILGIAAFYEIRLSPFYDRKNVFQGQIIVIRDITAQKESEKTIEDQSRFINAMLDNLPIGIFMVDAENGKPIIVNNHAKLLMGRGILPDATKENLSEVYEAFIAGTDQRYPTEKMPIARGMIGESSHIDDMEVRQPNGTRLRLEIVGCPITDSNGKVYASLVGFFDITERKKTEQYVQEQNERLQELIATKDRFFSIIAHDLKSPFNTIIGFGELLKNRVDEFTKEEVSEYSKHIYNAAIHTFKLLENLLEWSRIQQGTIKFQPSCQNLSSICNECLSALQESASIKEIELFHSIPDSVHIFVDKEMVSTIFRNLISNAIKFTPRKGKIELIVHNNSNSTVEVIVSDTGIGMGSDIKQNVFKIDGKVSRPGTEGEPSTGLGLLLCKEFAAKHGSEIVIESAEGVGSKFCFKLPKA
jgi:signal transduction histidine kinase